MGYIKKLPIFVFVLGSLWYIGLFCYFNQETIQVEIPYLGVFNIASAIVFLVSFISGAVFAAVFFAYDSLRKFFEIRKRNKQLKRLQKETEYNSALEPTITVDEDENRETVTM